jgi:hypothetical protein
MVDFSKKIINSNKFRQAAIRFQGSGFYCSAPVGSSEYVKYWDEETERCLTGYTAEDGDWISGYNYFYLNYCPILRIVEEDGVDRFGVKKRIRRKVREFPDFYDYDYFFFMAVQEAQDQGKHLAVLKSRRKGYSFKLGSMLDRNYYLIEESKSFAFAAENEFLIKDGIITKAWEYMDFIDEHTAWAKKRQKTDTKMHRRASIIVKDESGNITEAGYRSEIIGVTTKNDVNKVRGKSGQLIVIEEGGKFPNLLELWQIARPSVEQDGIAHGTMIVFGTGGSDSDDFSGLKELFYHPDGYNCLALDNIWDEGGYGSKAGFFIPQYANLDVRDENGARLYMDDDGNTITDVAAEYVLGLREDVVKNATDARSIDRYIAEQPVTPQEACLELTGNIFPKKELSMQLAAIRVNKKLQNHKQVGDLIWVNGELTWQQKKFGDVTKYPLGKDDDPSGAIVIWEHPSKDPPVGLYIAGNDPYDFDKAASSTSLGSTFVYKRFQGFEEYYDVIVAEYTGRPATANEHYETVLKLLQYYNARMLYENEKKGLFTYFSNNHKDYLLADQPDIISDIIGRSTVQRRKGIHMTKEIIKYSEVLIRDWLNAEFAPGHKNVERILSEPLLEELITYNDKGNFDRVRALQCVMIYREQLYNQVVKKSKEEIKKNLFESPLYRKLDYQSPSGIADPSRRKPIFKF